MTIMDIKTTVEFTLNDYELELVEGYAKEQGWTIEECMEDMIRRYINRVAEQQIDTWEEWDEAQIADINRCCCNTSNDCKCGIEFIREDPTQLTLDLKGEHDGK